jgi:hypothetical protein
MANKNLDVANSDSNSILITIIVILIVIGIAYMIYYLYNKNVAPKNNSNYDMMNSRNRINNSTMEETQAMNYRRMMNQEKLQNQITDENNLMIDHKMNGKPNLSNPIMNKTTYLKKGPIVGEDNIEHFSQNPEFSVERNLTSFPKEQLSAEELLPQDNSSLWAQVNPSGEGSLKDRNFLQSGYHIGINTVGQTLRNANLQLRSEPPCPQVKVSPWLQATIEPDLGRKPFEIGGCA